MVGVATIVVDCAIVNIATFVINCNCVNSRTNSYNNPYNFIFIVKIHFATPLGLDLEFEMSQKYPNWFVSVTTLVPFIFKANLTQADDK